MAERQFDLLIIGSGPAGLTAALYGQRMGLNVVVLGDMPGGNLLMIEHILNYPGFPGGVAGAQLGTALFAQAQSEGASIPLVRLESLRREENRFIGLDAHGNTYGAPAVIAAMGVSPRRLEVPNADLPGIHFCSLCDGPLFKGKGAVLAVVGDGNRAAHEALSLAKYADKVILLHREDRLEVEAALMKSVEGTPHIEMLAEAQVTAFLADERINGMAVTLRGREERVIRVDGVFVAIGWAANLAALDGLAETTPEGFLKTDGRLMTSVSGLFAAGDVRDTDLRQTVAACSDGARAALYAYEYLQALNRLL